MYDSASRTAYRTEKWMYQADEINQGNPRTMRDSTNVSLCGQVVLSTVQILLHAPHNKQTLGENQLPC